MIVALWAVACASHNDPRIRPFASIVEEIADHLAKVVRVDSDHHVHRQLVPPVERSTPRHVPHQAKKPVDRRRRLREGARGGRGADSPRPSQLAVDVAADQLELAVDLGRCLALATAFETVGLAGKDGQRSLEPVGQRTGAVARLADELLLTVEETVEVGDHRLDLAREPSAKPRPSPIMQPPSARGRGGGGVEALADLEPGADAAGTPAA